MTATTYVQNRTAHINATYYYFSDGTSLLKYEGEYFTQKEFDERYPLPNRLNEKENYDTTRSWMYS